MQKQWYNVPIFHPLRRKGSFMPYLFAHAMCAVRTRNALQKEGLVLAKHDELYRWGAQGPDIWFYHRPLNAKKTLRSVGNRMHGEHIETTLGAMLEQCRRAQGELREKRFAYFAGFLTHYALDAMAHPFVICRCGRHAYHSRFECEMDAALLELQGDSIQNKRTYDQMPPVEGEVVAHMHEAVWIARGEPLPEGEARQMVRQVRQGLIVMNDPRGVKRRIVRAVETLVGQRGFVSRFIYPTKADPARDVLNLKKNVWHMPWSGEERSESFLELLDAAVIRAEKYVRAAVACLKDALSEEETLKIFGGLSFDSGLPWRQPLAQTRFCDGVYDRP